MNVFVISLVFTFGFDVVQVREHVATLKLVPTSTRLRQPFNLRLNLLLKEGSLVNRMVR